MFNGVSVENYGANQPIAVDGGNGPHVPHRFRKKLDATQPTKVCQIAARRAIYSATTNESTSGIRCMNGRRASLMSVCAKVGLVVVAAGLYIAFMALQFRRCRSE